MRAAGAMALALLTALTVLAASMCAPLCAARTCLPSTVTDHCHGMEALDAKGGRQFLASVKTCTASELSAVLSKSNELNKSSRDARSDLRPALMRESHQLGFGALGTSLGQFNVYRGQLHLADSLLLLTILRV